MPPEREENTSPEHQRYSLERVLHIGDYRIAFLDVASSRGMSSAVLESIEQAGCLTVLEADTNDEEGDIRLPNGIDSLIHDIYPGAALYPDQALLVPTGAIIRVELFDDQPEGWKDWNMDKQIPSLDLLSPPQTLKRTMFNKQIYFDFLKGIYQVGVHEAESPEYYELGGEYVDSTEWQSRKLPNQVLADFISLPKALGERNTAKIAVYRRTSDDIFASTDSVPVIGGRG